VNPRVVLGPQHDADAPKRIPDAANPRGETEVLQTRPLVPLVQAPERPSYTPDGFPGEAVAA
jgi:hypothetical protein